MHLKQFRYSADNFSYLIWNGNSAMAIDPGAVESMRTFLGQNRLSLAFVTHTHMHPDHTLGTRDLLNGIEATLLDCRLFPNGDEIDLNGGKVKVYRTPGHTADSVTFHFDDSLVTGDTLFNGTVGNCFSGDLRSFYESICFLMGFDDHTRIYAGHDYVQYSMEFAAVLEPDNAAIETFLRQYDPAHVWSTLAQERQVNPYLRFNEPGIIDLLEKRGLAVGSEYERWESLMSID
jgi:hydroxyacylglutathione hydrolase